LDKETTTLLSDSMSTFLTNLHSLVHSDVIMLVLNYILGLGLGLGHKTKVLECIIFGHKH